MYVHKLQRTEFGTNPGQDFQTVFLKMACEHSEKEVVNLASVSSLRIALSDEPHFLLTESPHWESKEIGEKWEIQISEKIWQVLSQNTWRQDRRRES